MNDDDLVTALRARAASAVPDIHVSTERVLPRARRRRAVLRSAGTLAVAGVLVGAGSVALGTVGAWPGPVPPAASTSSATTGPAAPTSSATTEAGGRYWYTVTRRSENDGEHTVQAWHSRERPGMWFEDGDLDSAAARGPVNAVGTFVIDGERIDVRDPSALPADPDALEAVLRASVEADVRTGTDDDKVFAMARDLLLDHGLMPEDLRRAAWTVAGRVPGSTVTAGTDSSGREGEVLTRVSPAEPAELVLDPTTGLLLESDAALYLEQRWRDDIPVEPTLEMAGCVAWETC